MFHQGRILYTSLVSLIMTLKCLDPCQWSLMSLITGNQVKKTHKPRYCEKEKDKANKRILRSLSFDNNGNRSSLWSFWFFLRYGRLSQAMNNLG